MTDTFGSPPIVDTHTHLDDSAFDTDRDAVIEKSRAAGIRHFLNIGYGPDRWESSRVLRELYPDVDLAIGLHPQLAGQYDTSMLRDLEQCVEMFAPIAIGETGFDLFRSAPDLAEQERAFRGQLEIAAAFALPTIIHQRDASEELMTELDHWPDLAPIVLHSFDGTQRLADWARDRGCFVGIGGLATRRSAQSLRDALTRIEPDRLLLETDSPYLAPSWSTSRRNEPANLPSIAAALAPLWNLSGEELCWLTSANAAGLFSFPIVDTSPTTRTSEDGGDSPADRRYLKSRQDSGDSGSAPGHHKDLQS